MYICTRVLRVFIYPVYLCHASYISYMHVFHFIEKKTLTRKKNSNMEEQNFELKALMGYNSAEEFFDSDRYMLIDFNWSKNNLYFYC
jgi:hypothetical protein